MKHPWVLTWIWFVEDSSRLTCDLCGSSLKTRNNLLRHIKDHMDQQRYPCTICGASLKTQKGLLEHKIEHKNLQEGRRFPCTVCGKTFSHKRYLNNHKRCTHDASSPQKCPICKKVSKNAMSLRIYFNKFHNFN